MTAYLAHLRQLRAETGNAADRVVLDGLIAEVEAERAHEQARITMRILGERTMRQRYLEPEVTLG